MPAKINMQIGNGYYNVPTSYKPTKPVARVTPLNGNMVGRIFNQKPGCGSCGK
jgi:hypothetical protein